MEVSKRFSSGSGRPQRGVTFGNGILFPDGVQLLEYFSTAIDHAS